MAGQYLRDTRFRLALAAYRGDEFPILQLDAVHRHVDFRDINLVLLAVNELVVARDVGSRVADVAEKSSKRPVIVERQRQRANGSGHRFELDRHVHRDAELGGDGSLQRVRSDDFARLPPEEMHRVRRTLSPRWMRRWSACAATISPVCHLKRSTVCAAWCQSRLSVHDRGCPSALMFRRRKKNVCTSICWILRSPATMC